MIVDEASVKITPDTSSFAEELRAELESEIEAATAGLDNTIHIRVDVDSDAARAKLRQAMDDFGNDGSRAFNKLKDDEQTLFDDIAANAEKSRIKQTNEQTKLRDKLKALWQPSIDKLKKEQIDEKVRLDQIAASATKAAKAVADGGGAKAEEALAKARQGAEQATARLAAAEERLAAAREKQRQANATVQKAEEALARSRELDGIQAERVAAAEQRLEQVRNKEGATAKEIRQAEDELVRARADAERGAQTTSAAEDRLSAARGRASTANATLIDAENRVSQARNKVVESSNKVEESERRVAKAHEDSARSADRSAESHRRLGDRLKDAGDRGGILGGIFTGLGAVMNGFSAVTSLASGAADTLEGSLGDVTGAAKGFITSVIQMGGQMTLWLTIAEAVTFAIGAIGAAILGLPALIGAAAASFVVFKLGMQGIKNAYNAELKPALDQLKQQISTVFENGLKPQFRDLAQILIPAVTGGLKQLAGAFVEVSGRIVTVVTQSEGLNNIKGIIDKTTTAVRNLGPPLADLTAAFLRLANTGTILQNMVGIIQDLVTNVTNWLNVMQQTGAAEAAVQALRGALDATEKALLNVLTAAVNFFTQAAPGFDHLVTSVGNVVSSLVGDLGPAFGQVMDAAGRMLDRVPPAVWDGLKQSIRGVSQALSNFANSGAFSQIVQGVSDCINAFAGFVNVVSGIAAVTGAISDLRNGIGETNPIVRSLADRINDVIPGSAALDRAMGQNVDSLGHIIPPAQQAAGAFQGVGTAAQAVPGQVQPPMDQTANAVEQSMQRAQAAAQAGGQGVHDGVTTPLPPMVQTAQVSFDTLPPVVRDAMVGAAAAAQTGSDLVRTAVEQGFNAAAQAATTSMNGIQTAVVGAMQNVSSVVQTNMTIVQNAVQRAAQAIQTSFQQMAQAAQQGSQQVQQACQQAAQAAQQMQQQVQTAMTGMQTAVTQAFQKIQQVVTQTMTQVKTTIQQDLQQIVQNFQQAGQQLTQITQQTWDQINQIIQAGGQKAVAQCKQIAQQILQVFKDLAPQLEAAGRTMMERLAAGITAGGASAVAAARNVAAQIKAQFPASPAKEGPLSGRGDPLRAGGVIMQRLAQGIFSNGHVVRSALRPILIDFASVLAQLGGGVAAAAPTTGWTITHTDSSVKAPTSTRVADVGLADMAFSGELIRRLAGDRGQPSEPVPSMNPSDIRAALEGMAFRIEDDGRNGLVKIVRRQSRALDRR